MLIENNLINLNLNQTVLIKINPQSRNFIKKYFQELDDSFYIIDQYKKPHEYLVTRIAKETNIVSFTHILTKKEVKLKRSNNELFLLRNIQNPIYFTDKLEKTIGFGCQGIVMAQKLEDHSEAVACKFYHFSSSSNCLLKLEKDKRLSNLKQVLQKAKIASQLPLSKHILQYHGMIFSKECNQYGLVFEKINGCHLRDYLHQLPKEEKIEEIGRLFKEMLIGLKILSEANMAHDDIENNLIVRNEDKSLVLIDVDMDHLNRNAFHATNLSKKQFIALFYETLFDTPTDFCFSLQDPFTVINSVTIYPEIKIFFEKYFSGYQFSWDELTEACDNLHHDESGKAG